MDYTMIQINNDISNKSISSFGSIFLRTTKDMYSPRD